MAAINLIAIVGLSGTIIYVTRGYLRQRKAGQEPRCHIADHPEIAPGVNRNI